MPECLLPENYQAVDLSNLYVPPDELDLDASVAYTFVLVDGAFNASYWYPFGRLLKAAGHEVVHAEVEQAASTSFEDDAEVVRAAIKYCRNVVFMLHSRGIETARLLASEDLGRFVAAQVVSSGGPHAYTLDPAYPEAPESRYQQAYSEAIISKPNKMSGIRPEDAQHFLYHDVENDALVAAVTDNLRDQRNSEYDESPPFDLPSSDDLPLKVWLGANDRALNIARAYQVFKHWTGVTPDLLPTGHTPQLVMVNTLARYSIHFANQARKHNLI